MFVGVRCGLGQNGQLWGHSGAHCRYGRLFGGGEVFVEDEDKRDDSWATPVCAASAQGHLDVVRYLVCSGADKDKARHNGATPVHAAGESGKGF